MFFRSLYNHPSAFFKPTTPNHRGIISQDKLAELAKFSDELRMWDDIDQATITTTVVYNQLNHEGVLIPVYATNKSEATKVILLGYLEWIRKFLIINANTSFNQPALVAIGTQIQLARVKITQTMDSDNLDEKNSLYNKIVSSITLDFKHEIESKNQAAIKSLDHEWAQYRRDRNWSLATLGIIITTAALSLRSFSESTLEISGLNQAIAIFGLILIIAYQLRAPGQSFDKYVEKKEENNETSDTQLVNAVKGFTSNL